MSGHSHWARIKHKKEATDAKKGKAFSKIAKLIVVAARVGGSDPAMNLKLQYAVEKAKSANMPRDNIDRLIKKGAGELDGQQVEEITYEGYASGGVAIMVRTITDNRNRTTSELRRIFETRGGSLGGANSVAFLFESKGLIAVPSEGVDEEKLMTLVLDVGAENMEQSGSLYEITCEPRNFQSLRTAIEKAGYKTEVAQIARLPKNSIEVSPEIAARVMSLMELLEEHDDVEEVFSNMRMTQELVDAK
jgi:YebC/PmpR family DNA-binding regulatory protein